MGPGMMQGDRGQQSRDRGMMPGGMGGAAGPGMDQCMMMHGGMGSEMMGRQMGRGMMGSGMMQGGGARRHGGSVRIPGEAGHEPFGRRLKVGELKLEDVTITADIVT